MKVMQKMRLHTPREVHTPAEHLNRSTSKTRLQPDDRHAAVGEHRPLVQTASQHGLPSPVRTWPRVQDRVHRWLEGRRRATLASSLLAAVRDANSPRRLTAAVPVDRRAVRAARADLESLAALLASDEPVNPCGLEAVRDLLHDGGGPLYRTVHEDELREAVQRARRACIDEPERG
jgi:hypothetical protein